MLSSNATTTPPPVYSFPPLHTLRRPVGARAATAPKVPPPSRQLFSTTLPSSRGSPGPFSAHEIPSSTPLTPPLPRPLLLTIQLCRRGPHHGKSLLHPTPHLCSRIRSLPSSPHPTSLNKSLPHYFSVFYPDPQFSPHHRLYTHLS